MLLPLASRPRSRRLRASLPSRPCRMLPTPPLRSRQSPSWWMSGGLAAASDPSAGPTRVAGSSARTANTAEIVTRAIGAAAIAIVSRGVATRDRNRLPHRRAKAAKWPAVRMRRRLTPNVRPATSGGTIGTVATSARDATGIKVSAVIATTGIAVAATTTGAVARMTAPVSRPDRPGRSARKARIPTRRLRR